MLAGVAAATEEAAPMQGKVSGVEKMEGVRVTVQKEAPEAEKGAEKVEKAEKEAQERNVEIEALWRRDDRGDWTPELGRMHAAFSRGKKWGWHWAKAVSCFFAFEASRGYEESGVLIDTTNRLKPVMEWVGRGRHWNTRMPLGQLGDMTVEGSYVWAWWDDDIPNEAEWGLLSASNGKNGLLQVMAAFFGGVMRSATRRGRKTTWTWRMAVSDVVWVLEQLEDPEKIW
ncbi:hypothetical protein B0H13DRAFT_2331393 [Mycena leptocephala]|nr:hypothetical protein B0H13DRAFT_2331393 [Mycena leptocephala]